MYVDDDLALEAHYRVVDAAGLKQGATLSSEELADTLARVREHDGYRQALDMLSGRERTETEVARKLTMRGLPQPTVATVLDRLRNKGLIDDRRYAAEYVRTVSERRQMGPATLRAKLIGLGIASSTVDEALAEELPEERQRAIVERLAHRRLPRLRRSKGDDAKPSLYSYIIRRGFDYDIAPLVLDEIPDDD